MTVYLDVAKNMAYSVTVTNLAGICNESDTVNCDGCLCNIRRYNAFSNPIRSYIKYLQSSKVKAYNTRTIEVKVKVSTIHGLLNLGLFLSH